MQKKTKNFLKFLLEKGHTLISFLDNQYLKKEIDDKWSPVFIIGSPRSGTTLLYQLVLNSFNFAYIPNISNFFYTCPIFAAKVGLKIFPKYKSTFKSEYGYEKGLLSPSEAGNIWNRWFPDEINNGFNYTPAGYLNDKSQKNIYRLISWFQQIFNAPFISKNLKMSVRLQAIYEIFPDAIILLCNRNPIHTALSLLQMRKQKKRDWVSVMPKEIESLLTKNVEEQVCGQVYYIYKNIKEDLKLFNPKQILEINYEDLCSTPKKYIKKIHSFLLYNKVKVIYNQERILSKITISPSQEKSKEFTKLRSIFQNHYSLNFIEEKYS